MRRRSSRRSAGVVREGGDGSERTAILYGDARSMEAAPYFTEQLADTSSAAGAVRDADAAATVTGPDRTFDARLPCAADEGPAHGCDGREVTVGTPDPLLPGRGAPHVVGPSPGARRFGDEMALVGAREALDS